MATSRWGCGKSFGIAKDSATELRRACTHRRKWARRIFASGCSSWASASATDTTQREYQMSGPNQRGSKGDTMLPSEAANWHHADSVGIASTTNCSAITDAPAARATAWPTPTGRDYKGDYTDAALIRSDGKQVQSWATPNVPSRGPEKRANKAARKSGGEDTQTQAINWPTASARDCKGVNQHLSSRGTLDQLPNAAEVWTDPSSPQDAPTTDDGLNSLLAVWTRPSCPRLSPGFQWWLMGMPHPAVIFCDSEEMPYALSKRLGLLSTSCRAYLNQWKNQSANHLRFLIDGMSHQ